MSTHWTNHDGVAIAWSDLDDRHLWNIVRMQVRGARKLTRRAELGATEIHAERIARAEAAGRSRHAASLRGVDANYVENHARGARILNQYAARSKRLALSAAIDELARRGLLPNVDDLRVAWDRACGGAGGPNVADDPKKRPWCLVELWVGFRGVPTFTPEWLAKQRHMIKRSASVAP